jgi:rRNA-processing protein FCF1
MTRTVAIDTNALMMPVELDVRLFEELDRVLGGASADGEQVGFEPIVPQAVLEELRRLSGAGGGEETIAASVGHDLATDRCLPVDTAAAEADDAIVELAREGTADFVVTNDKPLKDRVLAEGVSVLSLRGTDKLAVTEP